MCRIHPRYKQDVAQRLVLGALNVAYGQKDVVFQGPFPSAFMEGQHTLDIQYDHGHAKLTVNNSNGFEVKLCLLLLFVCLIMYVDLFCLL